MSLILADKAVCRVALYSEVISEAPAPGCFRVAGQPVCRGAGRELRSRRAAE